MRSNSFGAMVRSRQRVSGQCIRTLQELAVRGDVHSAEATSIGGGAAMDDNDNASNRPGWIAYSLALAVLMGAGMIALATFGVPGSDGGSSPSQQEASGAPGPTTTGSR
jgi:hypothetical protein